MTSSPRPQGMPALLAMSVAVVLVGFGIGQGLLVGNLHNGVLGITFSFVGSWVLFQRPGHREGRLFLVTGLVEAALFLGRQVEHFDAGSAAAWGWLGSWPVPLAIGLTTVCLICFPEGRPLSARWAAVAVAAVVIGVLGSLVVAITGSDTAVRPVYVALQLSWLVAIGTRWREANGFLRRQLLVVVLAVAVALVALLAGLAASGSPLAGLLAVGLVPVASGWTMVNLSLAGVVEEERRAGHLEVLTSRENDVLDLMAQGLSNDAIAKRLHLSIKTVEPVVSSIFLKLGLTSADGTNRRVQAVVQYLGSSRG